MKPFGKKTLASCGGNPAVLSGKTRSWTACVSPASRARQKPGLRNTLHRQQCLVQLVAAGFSHGFRQADQPCHHRQCPLRRVAKAQADAPVQHFLCSQHDRSGGTLEHLPVAWLQVKRQCRPLLQLDSAALDRYCCARRRRRHISSSECRKSEAIARL